jgi:hypothetical protein
LQWTTSVWVTCQFMRHETSTLEVLASMLADPPSGR